MTINVIRRIWATGFAASIAVSLGMVASTPAHAQVSFNISVGSAPPPLPYYEQPLLPGPDFIWMPGYWAWGPAGYFWVPGSWVLAPEPGLLWTPGYWGWDNTAYYWHPGYWARHVGYYGGINYGYGYYGNDYVGGRWYGNHFRYNTAVTRVNTTIIRNVYVDKTVIINNNHETRVSYNGGRGGVVARPSAAQLAMHDRHVPPTSVQVQHERISSRDRTQLASVNHDHPQELSTAQPFSAQHRPATFQRVRPDDRVAAPSATSEPLRPRRPMTTGNRPNTPAVQGEGAARGRAIAPRQPARPMTPPAPQRPVREAPVRPAPAQPQAQPRPVRPVRPPAEVHPPRVPPPAPKAPPVDDRRPPDARPDRSGR